MRSAALGPHVDPEALLEPIAAPAVVAAVEVLLGLLDLVRRELAVQDIPGELLALAAVASLTDCLVGELRLEKASTAMEPGHDRAHRDVEDLGGVGVAEVADVDEHDDVAEVVGTSASAFTIESCESRSTTRSWSRSCSPPASATLLAR